MCVCLSLWLLYSCACTPTLFTMCTFVRLNGGTVVCVWRAKEEL